jgi:hypothetical protein
VDVWGLPCFIRVKVEPEARYFEDGWHLLRSTQCLEPL